LKTEVAERILQQLPETMRYVESYAEDAMNVRNTLIERMQKLSLKNLKVCYALHLKKMNGHYCSRRSTWFCCWGNANPLYALIFKYKKNRMNESSGFYFALDIIFQLHVEANTSSNLKHQEE
jgi:hypothetical protein